MTGATPPAPRLDHGLIDGLRAIVGAEHVLVDDATRALRTRGKSTPDLLRARAGDLADAPDAVVRPDGHAEVEAVLAWAHEQRVAIVPFGGGTCVTGGLAARRCVNDAGAGGLTLRGADAKSRSGRRDQHVSRGRAGDSHAVDAGAAHG